MQDDYDVIKGMKFGQNILKKTGEESLLPKKQYHYRLMSIRSSSGVALVIQ